MGLLLVNGLRTVEASRASVKDIHKIDGTAVLTLSLGKADLVQVQRPLRHSNPKVTMRYVESLDWLKDNAVDYNPISLK